MNCSPGASVHALTTFLPTVDKFILGTKIVRVSLLAIGPATVTLTGVPIPTCTFTGKLAIELLPIFITVTFNVELADKSQAYSSESTAITKASTLCFGLNNRSSNIVR